MGWKPWRPLPLLPKPDFILCPRSRGEEQTKGYYGRKTFPYETIQTKDTAEIDQIYKKKKIQEAEGNGPVYFVAHDASKYAEAAKSDKLTSLARYMKNGEVTFVPHFIWVRSPYFPNESPTCFIG